MSTNEAMALDKREFKVLLNGNQDLREQLAEFKKVCEAHEKHRHRRCKRRYYQLGLMARIVCETTDDELLSLLSNGTRTFLFDMVTNKPAALNDMVARTKKAIEDYQATETALQSVVGLAFEILGDCCRLGRLRNDCSVLLARGDVMTLTIDEAYKWTGFKEIMYVFNLKYHLRRLKLCNAIKIGHEVIGRVVKCLKSNVAILIEVPGLVSSFEYIEVPDQCHNHTKDDLVQMFREDLELAALHNADYIVMPKIRCKPFLRALHHNINNDYGNFKLIGTIDLEYGASKMLDLLGIIKSLDYLWIPDMFKVSRIIQTYIYQDVIPMAKCMKKPIIGSVPLERCSEFKRFENHEFLWKIDAMFIEKSSWCFKYPLIVKKLMPVRDFHYGVLDNAMPIKNLLTSYQAIVNFIIRTISTVECQAIFLNSRCETAATALSRVEIYCPVYVMLPLEGNTANEADRTEIECKLNLARTLNLRRNARAMVYTVEMNECNYTPIDYGIDYARKNGCIDTGDFIITVDVCKEDKDDVQVGGTEDVVVLRAYYLPPLKFTEKFMYS